MYKTIFFLLLLAYSSLFAKDHKLELGLGVGALYYPNYVGSKTTQVITVPLPYIRYRGDYFRIDEDGLSGKLFGVDGLRLDLSVSGSLPANSEESGVREGMPDLDLTGEVGLQLIYKIFQKGVSKLELELPIRAVLSTDFTNLKYRGVVANPQLKYSLNYSDFSLTLRSGVMMADENYNDYYYEVADKYATAKRPAYDAKGGFGGVRNRIGATYQKDSWWFGAFVSYFNIGDAAFNDSPLVQTRDALYAGASVAYIFYVRD